MKTTLWAATIAIIGICLGFIIGDHYGVTTEKTKLASSTPAANPAESALCTQMQNAYDADPVGMVSSAQAMVNACGANSGLCTQMQNAYDADPVALAPQSQAMVDACKSN